MNCGLDMKDDSRGPEGWLLLPQGSDTHSLHTFVAKQSDLHSEKAQPDSLGCAGILHPGVFTWLSDGGLLSPDVRRTCLSLPPNAFHEACVILIIFLLTQYIDHPSLKLRMTS